MHVELHIMDFTMKFRLHGKDHTVTLEMFAQQLECDDDGILNALTNYNYFITWNEL